MKIDKFKLKFKDAKKLWTFEGPCVRENHPNYHILLSKATATVKLKKGELHIYNLDGSLKEILNFNLL